MYTEATDPILPKRSTEESFRVISSRFIENVEGVKLPSERPVPEAIDLDDVMAREEIELDKASRDSERLMAGATHKGQLLYNYLSKIYNTECSWGSNHSIVIMRAVTISEPYELENVSGPASNVERIRNQMKKHYASMKK